MTKSYAAKPFRFKHDAAHTTHDPHAGPLYPRSKNGREHFSGVIPPAELDKLPKEDLIPVFRKLNEVQKLLLALSEAQCRRSPSSRNQAILRMVVEGIGVAQQEIVMAIYNGLDLGGKE